MSARKTIYLVLVLFISAVFLAPNIVFAVNHEYVGCVRGGIDKSTGNCPKPDDARKVCYEGMVPCGKAVTVAKDVSDNNIVKWNEINKACDGANKVVVNCQLCHFFVMFDGIMDFILVDIVPPITVAVLVIGGAMYYLSGFKPELRNKSKTLFKSVLIGLVLIYGAYMIAGIVLMVLGSAEMNPLKSVFDSSKGIFSIICPVEVP